MTRVMFAEFLYSDPDPGVIWLKKAMLVIFFGGTAVVLGIYFLAGL